jgi:hypothetical protein
VSNKSFVILVLVSLLIGCFLLFLFTRPVELPNFSSIILPTPTPAVLGAKTGPDRIYPDPKLTPGDVFESATKEIVCKKGYTTEVRNVSVETKRQVYWSYGLTYPKNPGDYEVDHFVPLSLGGSNDVTNLWPEPGDPKPGYHEKDEVEYYLYKQVCSGKIPLKEAQNDIKNDWYQVYLEIRGM